MCEQPSLVDTSAIASLPQSRMSPPLKATSRSSADSVNSPASRTLRAACIFSIRASSDSSTNRSASRATSPAASPTPPPDSNIVSIIPAATDRTCPFQRSPATKRTRLARSDTNTPSGSAPSRTARHSSSRGYIRPTRSGVVRESFAKYRRPPAASIRSSSSSQNRPSPGLTGKSRLSMRPGCGHDKGAGLPSPIRLKTLRNDRWPDSAISRTMSASCCSAPYGIENWYCRKPARPYARFHSPSRSSGW